MKQTLKTYVFANDLLQGKAQDSPRENLDILFDVTRLRGREAHDDLEEFFAVGLGLGDREGTESFQVTTNAILLLNGESDVDEGLEQVNGIHTGDIALIFTFPCNAANADALGDPLLGRHGLECRMDGASGLGPIELHEPTLSTLLILAPTMSHGVKVSTELENGLARVHSVRVEVLAVSEA